jgi:MoaA/NifB/PqqE/SkfB family radical SAM enzyme
MPSITHIAKKQMTLATHRIYTMPVVVLMPHSRCNCRCVMCDIWKANRNGQAITAEQLEPHLKTFRELNVRQVVLSGGEALMHPNLWTLCAHLKTLNVEIILLSTGLLLSRSAHDIVTRCNEVIVSLDGSRDVHDAIRRVPHAYDRLAEGVAALRAVDPSFRVTARCVLQRMNYKDLPHIITAAHDLSLDQISFLAADVSTEAFNRPEGWDQDRVAEVALNPAELAECEQILETTITQYKTDFASGFIAEKPDKLRRIYQYYAALNGQGELPEPVCNAPWVSTVIEADGTVRPCFFHRPLGNIHQQPLMEILNSDDAVAFRRQLDVKQDAICRKCVCTLYIAPIPYGR